MQETEDRSGESSEPSSVFRIPSSDLSSVPLPPWELEGAAIVFLHDWRSVLALVRYDASPVGPYEELAVATLTVHGPTVTEMVVNSALSMMGGRRGWGFPKVLGALRWRQSGQRIIFDAGNHRYRVKMTMAALPIKLNGWCWQILDGRRVRVPVQLRGRARVAWQGRRIAVVVELLVLRVLRPEL